MSIWTRETEPAPTRPAAPPCDGIDHDAEALFREARRRTRRRRLWICAAGAVTAGIVASGVAALRGGTSTRPGAAAPARSSLRSREAGGVALRNPTSLAVSASGTLYVLDSERDQVLRLTRSGRFVVFAGSGRKGFSGDGGLATRADLRLSGWSTLAVASDGTVYIADSGNGRVRAVAPDGVIRTVAGDGRGIQHVGHNPPLPAPWTGARPALDTAIGAPRGIATAPGGRLDIDGDALISLALRTDTVSWLAGAGVRRPPMTNRQELEQHFSNGYGDIAVDGAGNVYLANFPELFERTAGGRLRFLGDGFRAGGGPAQLAEGPGGSVYEAAFGVARLSTAGPGRHQLVQRFSRSILSARRIDEAVGWDRLAHGRGGAILAPATGLAVAASGDIYYATDSGTGWASGALVEVTAAGGVRVLWRAAS